MLLLQVYFIYCARCPKADAPGVFAAIKRSVEEIMPWQQFLDKLVAMGSDGASVMTGEKGGVITLLRNEQGVVGIHCYNHKLELSYKDAVKSVSLDRKVCAF